MLQYAGTSRATSFEALRQNLGPGITKHANRMACRVNLYVVSGYKVKGEDRIVD